jgi:transcriptional regulator with PAS, ATPase and Fis domain
MNIHEMVAENTFRQDLLYRINTVEIKIPPLRDRINDIPLLVDHFITMYASKYRKKITAVKDDAMNKLQAYNWPGNIRELQHALERAIIMSDHDELTADDFFFLTHNDKNENITADNYNLEEIERNVIKRAIDKHGGNISKAAKELGLTRASLYRRLEKHGL